MLKICIDFIGVSIELFILFLFFHSIFPDEKKFSLKLLITSTITFILTLTLSTVSLNLVQRILLVWTAYCIFSLPFPAELSRKILLSFFPVSINSCMEILAGAIQIVIYDSIQLIITNNTLQYTQGIILSKCLSLLFIFFLVKSSYSYLKTISKMILAAFVFVLCISTILVHQLFPLLLLSDDTYLHFEFLFICSSIVSMNVVFFYIIYYINKQEQTNLDYIHITNSQKAQEILTRELTKKQEETNILIHDIHNKLLTLSTYAKQKNYAKLLASLQYLDEELQTNKISFTRYPELDVLLYTKINSAKQKDIIITPIISDFELFSINIFDFNTIIGNLLDNAIEGCKINTVTGRKNIKFIIKTQGNLLFIIVENSLNEKIHITKNQLIPTTKNDKKLHGIGLKSIQYYAKKYHGNFHIDSTNDKFTAIVMLPLVK